jgi:hypothetical protein
MEAVAALSALLAVAVVYPYPLQQIAIFAWLVAVEGEGCYTLAGRGL